MKHRNHSGHPPAAQLQGGAEFLLLLTAKLCRPPVTPDPEQLASDGKPGVQPPSTADPDLGAGWLRQDHADQHVAASLRLPQRLAIAGREGQRSEDWHDRE